MGRHKKEIDELKIVEQVKEIIEESRGVGEHISKDDLAKRVKLRKGTLTEILDRHGIQTDGDRVRGGAHEGRVNKLDCAELIGLYMQGTSKETVQEDETVLAPQKAVAAAFVLPKYSKNFAQTKIGSPLEDLLAPSFISKDAMRITRFESLVMDLLARLDDPLNRSIDFSPLKEAVRSFSGFVRHGYDVLIVIHCHGIDAPGIEELKTYASGVVFRIWDRPFVELLANISAIDVVSCAGAGFFPLLGATNEKLWEILKTPNLLSNLKIEWTEAELHAALERRLRVCDALAGAGLLYGAPQNKVGEMVNKGEATISRRLLSKSLIYGDGLNTYEGKRPLANIALGLPIRLRPKYLRALPIDAPMGRQFIEIQKVEFEGKLVDCLVAWQPQIRDMLLRALRNPDLNALHAQWVSAQERAIADNRLETYRESVEIVNPEGTMRLDEFHLSSTAAKLGFLQKLAIGMLITAYDADSVVGRLISLRDWRACGQLQQKWTDEVVTQISNNSGPIIALAKWADGEMAAKVLQKYILAMCASKSRLIRFIIEQAAVNYSRALLRTSRGLGLNCSGWPDNAGESPDLIERLTREMEGYWPVVGIRLDHLKTGVGHWVRRHLRTESQSRKRRRDTEIDYHKTIVSQSLSSKKETWQDDDKLTGDESSEEGANPPDEDDDSESGGW